MPVGSIVIPVTVIVYELEMCRIETKRLRRRVRYSNVYEDELVVGAGLESVIRERKTTLEVIEGYDTPIVEPLSDFC